MAEHSCVCLYLYIGGCEPLPGIENGDIDVTGRSTGDTATYSCDTGFNLVGPSTRTCQASGVWSLTAPVCRGEILFQ